MKIYSKDSEIVKIVIIRFYLAQSIDDIDQVNMNFLLLKF
jgi:hypothetical protein